MHDPAIYIGEERGNALENLTHGSFAKVKPWLGGTSEEKATMYKNWVYNTLPLP